MGIRRSLALTQLGLVAILLGLAWFLWQHQRDMARLPAAEALPYSSYVLADEFRQTADELTRLARTCVATGDGRYEQAYHEVLAIRRGDRPRLAAADGRRYPGLSQPNRLGAGAATASLPVLLQQAGFTEPELARLNDCAAAADTLVRHEVAAMNAAKGLFFDAHGGSGHLGPPDPVLALRLLDDAACQQLRESLRRSTDDVLAMVAQRTARRAADTATARTVERGVVIGLASLLCISWIQNRSARRAAGQLERASAALQRSEARYRLLFEQAGDCILVVDEPVVGLPVIRDANAAALRQLGYTRDELCGQPVTLIDGEGPDGVVERAAARRQVLDAHQEAVLELRHRRRDGTEFTTEATLRRLETEEGSLVVSVERDITVRKQVEEETRLSLALQRIRSQILNMEQESDWQAVLALVEEELRGFIDFYASGVNLIDVPAGRVTYFSRHGRATVGSYDHPRHPVFDAVVAAGQPVYRPNRQHPLFDPTISEQVRSVVDAPFAGGTLAINSCVENAFSTRDLEVVARFAQVLSEAHRRVLDLSARHQAEDALRLSEIACRTIIDTAMDGFWVVDSAGTLLAVNGTYARLAGRSASELVGTPVSALEVETEAQDRRLVFSAVAAAGQTRFTSRHRRLDGSTFSVEVAAQYRDLQGGQLVCFVRDLTPVEQVSVALRETREITQLFWDVVPDLICIAGPDGFFKQVNPAWERALGYRSTELLTTPFEQLMHPDDIQPTRDQVATQLAGGRTLAFVNRYRTRAGDWRWLEWNAAATADGALLVAAARDVTERRQLESQLESQRLQALQSDRLLALGEMATGVAHELNQPLSGVRAFAEGIRLGLERGWPFRTEEVRDAMADIIQQADRMAGIIGHMRDFARSPERDVAQGFSLHDVVGGAMKLIGAQLREHSVVVRQQLAASLPLCVGQPNELEQVVLNLLTNARDALDDRRAAQRADASRVGRQWQPRVTLSTTAGDGWVRLAVTDNAGGIPESAVGRIFEPFFTTKPPGKGTGVGLAISLGIVERHGGRIEVENDLGTGVTFAVVLPTAPG